MIRGGSAVVLLVALALVAALGRVAVAAPAPAPARDPQALVAALATEDPRALDAAVAAIEHAPTSPELADALFAAGRACEDRLADPARALAIYQRIVRELPDARVAEAAGKRARQLEALAGAHGEFAAPAAELARLVAGADRLPAGDVIRRASALANRAWPGAPDAALWLAEWLRRAGRFEAAQQRYADVIARWPGSPHATRALRGAAGCALDAHDWARARALAGRLPAAAPADRSVRNALLAAAARGRTRGRLYTAAWLALALALAGLLGSLVEAVRRRAPDRAVAEATPPAPWPRRLGRAVRPPAEVLFLAPVLGVLSAVAFTAHRLIAPAVARISLVGIAATWLSGAALDRLRAAGRPVRARAAAHVLASVVAVTAIGYIAVMHDGLLDLLIRTVRFGPDR